MALHWSVCFANPNLLSFVSPVLLLVAAHGNSDDQITAYITGVTTSLVSIVPPQLIVNCTVVPCD